MDVSFADRDLNSPVELFAAYTSKDLILYALALGFGTSPEKRNEELKFLYERHKSFTAVPTFCVVLTFWAGTTSSRGMQPFPTVLMRTMGVIPKRLLRVDKLPATLPVIHVRQSITWHHPLPVPVMRKASHAFDSKTSTLLQARFVSVVPKKFGTFVTTETDIVDCSHGSATGSDDTRRICTMESTALVMGVPPEAVIPYNPRAKDSGRRRQQRQKFSHRVPDFEWTYATTPAQALLYRVASGDSNSIHVDPATATQLGGDGSQPILHGLCTLGIATRAILQYFATYQNVCIRHLAGEFTKPVFVGDKLGLRIWKERQGQGDVSKMELFFNVYRMKTNEIVVDQGHVVVVLGGADASGYGSCKLTSSL